MTIGSPLHKATFPVYTTKLLHKFDFAIVDPLCGCGGFLITINYYLSIMADKKTPQEASNIFHSIMKVSVSKTATEKKDKPKVKPKTKK